MSVKVKIVVTMINLACLLATLAFPNDTTPFAVLITIVSVAAWAFHTYEDKTTVKSGLMWYIVGVSLMAMISVLLGIATNIKMVDSNGVVLNELTEAFDHYVFSIKPGAFIASGKNFGYTTVAMTAFGLVAMFSIVEIIATLQENKAESRKINSAQVEPISVTIQKQIGHLR